jgi:hypothetical protein
MTRNKLSKPMIRGLRFMPVRTRWDACYGKDGYIPRNVLTVNTIFALKKRGLIEFTRKDAISGVYELTPAGRAALEGETDDQQQK